MFKKILVAEDIDSINMGLISALKQFKSVEVQHTKYCDEALLKIKRAKLDGVPFDLLITDLSFKADHRIVAIPSGEELAEEARKIQPDIKIIIYSVEDRPVKIKSLYEKHNINGYVSKGRNSTSELLQAIRTISEGERYLPQQIHPLKDNMPFEIEVYDIELLKCLSKGLLQEEISAEFKNKGYSSSSRSSIEKRLNKLRAYFNAKNATHLVSITKDMGLI